MFICLSLDPVNACSLQTIESAQRVFCLDHAFPAAPPPSDGSSTQYWDPIMSMQSSRYLHGNGSSRNSCNRWFDAACQVSGHRKCWVDSNREMRLIGSQEGISEQKNYDRY